MSTKSRSDSCSDPGFELSIGADSRDQGGTDCAATSRPAAPNPDNGWDVRGDEGTMCGWD